MSFKFLLTIILLLLLTAGVEAAWLSSYTYRKQIDIDGDTYISGNLTDQTVAVNIPSSNTNFWANDDGTGTYVRFTLRLFLYLKPQIGVAMLKIVLEITLYVLKIFYILITSGGGGSLN